MSDDLLAQLARVLDEDERIAQAVDPKSVGWLADYGSDCSLPGADEALRRFADPARTLRMAAAHRRILELHQQAQDAAERARFRLNQGAAGGGEVTAADERVETLTAVVRVLVEAYDVAAGETRDHLPGR